MQASEVNQLWTIAVYELAKMQVVKKTMMPKLNQDMRNRKLETRPDDDISGIDMSNQCFVLDRPGMIMSDRTYQSINIDGLPLQIPSEDFEFFYDELQTLPERYFEDGTKYYKIHGWIHAVVLSADQKDLLMKTMGEMLEEAKVLAKHDNDEFVRRMNKINENGQKIVSAKHELLKAPQVPKDQLN